jgi:hypothetical protein
MSVLLIGDSHAVFLKSHLRAKLGNNLIDGNPISATKTTQWTSKTESLVSQYQPDVVVVCLGTNDEGGSSLTQVQQATERIANACAGAFLLWCLPLTRSTIVKEKGVSQVIQSIVPNTLDPDDLNLPIGTDSDGKHIHATQQGYEIWADAIINYLNGVTLATTTHTDTTTNTLDSPDNANDETQTDTNSSIIGVVAAFLVVDWLFRG